MKDGMEACTFTNYQACTNSGTSVELLNSILYFQSLLVTHVQINSYFKLRMTCNCNWDIHNSKRS